MIPVIVLTGFLGSGKTTLLARLLTSPDLANTAVIVNEFGETDLDHSLIAASSENILELVNGCVCCTIRKDLALELRDLFLKRALGDVPRFDRVVIETTGVADPVPVVHTFMANTELKKVYRMQSVVTLVDALAGQRTLDEHAVSVRQAAMADVLLISKTDLVAAEVVAGLQRRLAALNPGAQQSAAQDFCVDDLRRVEHYPLKNLPGKVDEWMPSIDGDDAQHDGINTFTLCLARPLTMADLVLFFQELVNYRPQQLLRVKGLIQVVGKEDTPAVIHAVREKVYPVVWLEAWPGFQPASKLVFITCGIAKAEIVALFEQVCGQQADSAPVRFAADH